MYELHGRHVTDEPGLHLAPGEASGGPGGYFGCNADALLCGGFGVTTPCTLVRRDSAVARRALGTTLNDPGEPDSRFGVVLECWVRALWRSSSPEAAATSGATVRDRRGRRRRIV